MKYLRKFDSVSEMNTAIQGSSISFMGLAYNNGTPVMGNKVVVPQPNDEIWYTSSDGNIVTLYSVAFGDGITVVSNTYSGGKGIIKLSGNATTIGENAFFNCNKLISITIPNSVTSIGQCGLSGTGLTSITIPNSITSISHRAFQNCRWLSSVTIPNSVTSIGENVFNSCPNLTSITIPSSVTTISRGTFQYCTGLTSITIPNSITSIGDYAFNGCTGLTSITIPNTVTSIGDSAFGNCSGLTSITIPNSVTSIGRYAFNGCTGLTSITIPDTVTTIGISAFYNVTTIYYNGSATGSPWGAKYINPYYDGDFIYTSSAKTVLQGYTGNGGAVTIPNGVVEIFEKTFSECTGLTSVTIPNGVTTIGSSAFWNCSNLSTVMVGSGITSFGYTVFTGCTGLTSFTCLAIEPPTMGYDFDEGGIFPWDGNYSIYVPAASVDAYKAARGWDDYASYIQAIQE